MREPASLHPLPPSADTASLDDAALMRGIARGDERAFRTLSDRYAGLIFSVAFRMRPDRGAAEDIVQETLLRLWKHGGDWDPNKGASVKTWLCRIATNLTIDAGRRRKHDSGTEVPDRADDAANAEENLAAQERSALVAGALQTLNERQRSAITLFHYEGLSMAEIATVLHTTPKATEGLLARARAALQVELLKSGGISALGRN